jgi:hypothetical protein
MTSQKNKNTGAFLAIIVVLTAALIFVTFRLFRVQQMFSSQLALSSSSTKQMQNPNNIQLDTRPSAETEKILKDLFLTEFNKGRWAFPKNERPHVALVEVYGNFGVIWVGMEEVSTNQLLQIPAGPIPVALDSNHTWTISFPGESDYIETLLNMPTGLIPNSILSEYFSSSWPK